MFQIVTDIYVNSGNTHLKGEFTSIVACKRGFQQGVITPLCVETVYITPNLQPYVSAIYNICCPSYVTGKKMHKRLYY
jgi:hypothetical protein